MAKNSNQPVISKTLAWILIVLILITGLVVITLQDDNSWITRNLLDTQTEVQTVPEEPVIEEVVVEPEVTPLPEPAVSTVTQLNCSNCWLAPVDKTHKLPSSYAPTVVATGLSGGGSLTSEASAALNSLFSAASGDSIALGVISAYRSYTTQQTTFKKWVNVEIANGYSRAEAEEVANTYSARPGHSEHQLGTTADIGCKGCRFEESTANLNAWHWLAANAADYGFVISYPEGRTTETGYTYEPWHYRYIGDTNAANYTSQSALTLNNWLKAL